MPVNDRQNERNNDCKMQHVKKIFACPSLFWVAQVDVDHRSVSFDITGIGTGILRKMSWIQPLTGRMGAGMGALLPLGIPGSTASPEAKPLLQFPGWEMNIPWQLPTSPY